MSITCEMCSGTAHVIEEVREVKIGRRSAEVKQEAVACDACDEVYVTPEQYEENRLRAVRAMRQEEGLLLPVEIVALRETLGLTQEGLEQLIGIGPKTVVRWENGSVFQNSATDTLMRLLIEHPSLAGALPMLRNTATHSKAAGSPLEGTFRAFKLALQQAWIREYSDMGMVAPRTWKGTRTFYHGPQTIAQPDMFAEPAHSEAYSAVA